MSDNLVEEFINANVENASAEVNGTTGKVPATFEGMVTAYASLIIMALVPIFFGSLQSVKFQQKQKDSGEVPETMSHQDAAMFPLYASCALFGLYLFFMIFSKEYINMLLTVYFFVLGVFALTHILEPLVEHFIPAGLVPFSEYHIRFTKKGKPDQPTPEEIVDVKFSNVTLGCMATSTVVGIWYLKQKHWIANNVLGLAFAMNGVEILQINSVITGCILLGGLFIYDVFWVFGTNVMVTVAKSFEAPVKLVFPQDLFEKGLSADNFAMLGLGDIVIPGIFIALLLRFDHSLKGGSRTYFYATFLAYFLGLLTTVYVMHAFKHAQPALLYLVPACLGTPFLVALFKGELGPLLHYKDHHGEAKTDEQVKKDDEPEADELAKKNE